MKNENLNLTLYTKGNNNNWYCDAYYYDGETFNEYTTKATGYGYDKQSSALSKAINKHKNLYTRYGKQAKKYKSYGLDENNEISYGIGLNAVKNCVECFKNVDIIEWHEGRHEIDITLKIKGVK